LQSSRKRSVVEHFASDIRVEFCWMDEKKVVCRLRASGDLRTEMR